MQKVKCYEGSEPYVFISYSHKDADRVMPILSALTERGYRIWYDDATVPGTEWPDYIAEHLLKSSAVLAFVSANFAASKNCRQELIYAISKNKYYVGVYLEQTELPPGIELQLSSQRNIEYYRLQDGMKEFCEGFERVSELQLCREIAVTAEPEKPVMSVKQPEPEKPAAPVKQPEPEKPAAPVKQPEPEKPAAPVNKPTPDNSFVIEAGVLIKYHGKDSSVVIPDNVTEIGKGAFKDCRSLRSVTFPPSLTKIGEGAFSFCWNLESISVPDSVTEIDDGAFKGCSSLGIITLPSSVTRIGAKAFKYCRRAADENGFIVVHGCLYGYYGNECELVIPASVTKIGYAAFFDCTDIVSVEIPDSVTEIDERAFWDCRRLSSVTVPDSVTEIGDSAFKGCRRLGSITIPASVTRIGSWAFKGCKGLTVHAPEGSYAEEFARENGIPVEHI